MKALAQIVLNFPPAPTTKARCERDELLDKFLAKINPSRIKDGYRPYSYGRLAGMLEGKSEFDLHRLYAECAQASDFSRLFHWKIKRKV